MLVSVCVLTEDLTVYHIKITFLLWCRETRGYLPSSPWSGEFGARSLGLRGDLVSPAMRRLRLFSQGRTHLGISFLMKKHMAFYLSFLSYSLLPFCHLPWNEAANTHSSEAVPQPDSSILAVQNGPIWNYFLTLYMLLRQGQCPNIPQHSLPYHHVQFLSCLVMHLKMSFWISLVRLWVINESLFGVWLILCLILFHVADSGIKSLL